MADTVLIEDNDKKAYAALLNLGGMIVDIRRALTADGIKGIRRDNCQCPISRYLRTRGFEYKITGFYAASGEHMVRRFVLPGPISVFIRMFDEGSFPELEETHAQGT